MIDAFGEARDCRSWNRGDGSIPRLYILWQMRQIRVHLQPRTSLQRVGRQNPRLR